VSESKFKQPPGRRGVLSVLLVRVICVTIEQSNNHRAIEQPRLYDCSMVTQMTFPAATSDLDAP
jgi:hypothetical protein